MNPLHRQVKKSKQHLVIAHQARKNFHIIHGHPEGNHVALLKTGKGRYTLFIQQKEKGDMISLGKFIFQWGQLAKQSGVILTQSGASAYHYDVQKTLKPKKTLLRHIPRHVLNVLGLH